MRLGLISLTVLALLTATAHAQRRGTVGRQGPRTSVQLPTFHYFGISTSVLVPDRGAVMLGGIGGSTSGRTSRGLPLAPGGSSAIGGTSGASSVSVHAWIHDLQAMDQAVLAEAARRRGASPADAPLRVQPTGDDDNVTSVNKIKRDLALAESTQQDEARGLFEKALQLQSAGKPGVAKIYFQMALRRADGQLKQEVSTFLNRLSQSPHLASGQ